MASSPNSSPKPSSASTDLGMEAIYEFEVVEMPATAAVDGKGTSVHQTAPPNGKPA